MSKKTVVITAIILGLALGTVLVFNYFRTEEKPNQKTASDKKKVPEKPKQPAVTEDKPQPTTITVYFTNQESTHLIPEKRQVSATRDSTQLATIALQKLIEGPQQANHISTLPQGTKLLDVEINKDTATVNFGSEFAQNYPQGSAGEIITLYSVVNTLTEIPEIKKVKFLSDGKLLEDIDSNYDLTQPFTRDENIIQK